MHTKFTASIGSALGGAALLLAGCAADLDSGASDAQDARLEAPTGEASGLNVGPGGEFNDSVGSDLGLPSDDGSATDDNPVAPDPEPEPDPDPWGPDIDLDPSSTLALLVSDGYNRSVQILDGDGDLVETIEYPGSNFQSFTWHPDGFFVAVDGYQIVQANLDGSVVPLFDTWGITYRINVTDGGDIDVAEESFVSRYAMDGSNLGSVSTSGACYMDTGLAADGTSVALDVWLYKVVEFDGQAVSDRVTSLPNGVNVLGRDSSDTFWVTTYGAELYVEESGTVARVGSLTELGQPADTILAIEPASDDAVYVLYGSYYGDNGIAAVDADGDLVTLVEADGQQWLDLVSLR